MKRAGNSAWLGCLAALSLMVVLQAENTGVICLIFLLHIASPLTSSKFQVQPILPRRCVYLHKLHRRAEYSKAQPTSGGEQATRSALRGTRVSSGALWLAALFDLPHPPSVPTARRNHRRLSPSPGVPGRRASQRARPRPPLSRELRCRARRTAPAWSGASRGARWSTKNCGEGGAWLSRGAGGGAAGPPPWQQPQRAKIKPGRAGGTQPRRSRSPAYRSAAGAAPSPAPVRASQPFVPYAVRLPLDLGWPPRPRGAARLPRPAPREPASRKSRSKGTSVGSPGECWVHRKGCHGGSKAPICCCISAAPP